jgi:hypothetical protein
MSQLYMIHDLSQSLKLLLETEVALLRHLTDATAATRPGGDSTWSPKEELGHLIDSAANNHIRFVCALIQPEMRGPTYAQNEWVKVHQYQSMPWRMIVDFWYNYNSFLTPLLENVPENKLQTLCFISSGAGLTLRFLVDDYVLHIQHHIDHLLGREHVTAYPAPADR